MRQRFELRVAANWRGRIIILLGCSDVGVVMVVDREVERVVASGTIVVVVVVGNR